MDFSKFKDIETPAVLRLEVDKSSLQRLVIFFILQLHRTIISKIDTDMKVSEISPLYYVECSI
jgi:hypothetical protein